MSGPRYDVVIPTAGRESLFVLLAALADSTGPAPDRVIVVDDTGGKVAPDLGDGVEIVRGRGAGPAAARNLGWQSSDAEWIAFLDDDVVPDPEWRSRLVDDLAGLAPEVAGSQGRIRVPLPHERRPTDWERNVRGLETARWATADMCFRRAALAAVGGFDERFPRAYREDADLALRLRRAGFRLVQGRRTALHPVRPAGRLASLRAQAGNADDALMAALHGPDWRDAADVPRGRFARHAAIVASGALGVAALLAGRRRVAAAAIAGWLTGTIELAVARIAPGPRTVREITTTALTSLLIPSFAVFYRVAGGVRARLEVRAERPHAVLLDRDGTLIVDVPYNGDPARVRAIEGAREALDRLREAGIPLAIVSNQSGVGRGLLTTTDVDAVNRRVEELLGPIDSWAVCPHAPDQGCACRKPAPGLILRAAEALGVEAGRCVVVGDIGSDVEAARAAGARSILVPTSSTRPEEIRAAPEVASSLGEAVDRLLGARR